jgi:hypothetical protein
MDGAEHESMNKKAMYLQVNIKKQQYQLIFVFLQIIKNDT